MTPRGKRALGRAGAAPARGVARQIGGALRLPAGGVLLATVTLWAVALAGAAPAPSTSPKAPPTSPSATAPPRLPAPATPAARLTMRAPAPAHGGFLDDLDCSACHTEEGWGLGAQAGGSGFDHDRTGFALRGAHAQAPCSGCHGVATRPASACEGCHRDPHQGRHDGACAECHTAVAWSDTRTLDQHRRTRMPLTGRHATLDCAACHRRGDARAFSGTPTDCFGCHRADYRRAASPHKHDGTEGPAPFSRQCSLCHNTAAWSPAFVDPAVIARTAALGAAHDAVFVLSSGSHRTAECGACHVDARRTQRVRCDGCHGAAAVRAQHARPVARAAAACLACHPRGRAR
ncbi:MAG: hypothetical protein R3B48_18110 [Kofleriaceae bacterium]